MDYSNLDHSRPDQGERNGERDRNPPGRDQAPPKHNIEAMREDYYQRIAKHGMTPLWKVMNSVVTKEPVTRCAGHLAL